MPGGGKRHTDESRARIAAGVSEYWRTADTTWHRSNIGEGNERRGERTRRIEPRWTDRDPSETVRVGLTVADAWGIYRYLARRPRGARLAQRFAASVDRDLARRAG